MATYFKRLPVFGILLLICFFYYSLKDVPIRIWDEAIYSNNAIEMARSHNYFVLTNNGLPSYYNTKPPMAIWLESLAINLFGINEFSVRLPSMLAVLGTVIGLIYFLDKNRFPLTVQLISVLTLLTSPRYMGMHVAATGDLDALLTMWTSFFALSIFDLVLNNLRNLNKRIWLTGFFFLCAFFTKSTAALLIFPGSLIVLLLFGNTREIILNKHFFLVSLLCFGLIAAYYAAVTKTVPGYFENAWHSEVERLYSNIMPWHNHAWYFYFENLFQRFWFWVFLLVPALAFPLLTKDAAQKTLFFAALIDCASFLFMISIPAVKLEFYDAQIYPFLALIIALAVNGIYTFIKKKTKIILAYTFIIIVVGIGAFLFQRIIEINTNPVLFPQEIEGAFVKRVFNDLKPHNSKVLMTAEHPEHYDQLHFYRKKYAAEFKSNIKIVDSVLDLEQNDTVFVCQQTNKDSLLLLYRVDTIKRDDQCLLVKILNKKF